jgi:phosphatidylglycerol:prolipoprotein diacylglycerol transferase
MIPYFELMSLQFGPLKIYVWGLMVAAGLLTAVFLGRRLGGKAGLDRDVLLDLAIWVMIGALIFGRIVYILA